MARHKLVSKSTDTGNDEKFFYDAGDGDFYIVHLQEWADIDESAVAEYGKYNVVAHHVNVRGFDCPTDETGHPLPNTFGESVRDSLKSCGFEIYGQTMADGTVLHGIWQPYDGAIIVARGDKRTFALVVADCMYGYGAGDRIEDESGNNKRTLLKMARNAF